MDFGLRIGIEGEDRRTQNWQIQLNKAQAELNGMEHELDANEKALAGFSDETDDNAENMSDATAAAGKLSRGVDGQSHKTILQNIV